MGLRKREMLILYVITLSCIGPFDPYNPDFTTNMPSDSSKVSTPTNNSTLIAWWDCNDSSLSNLTDKNGKYNGIIYGCTRDSGIEGLCLRFDGSDDKVLITAEGESPFNFGNGDFTISLWVKPFITEIITDSTRYDIIAKGIVRENGYAISIFRNRFCAFVGIYQSFTGDTSFPANSNRWHHVVMVRRKGTVELYVNGKIVNSYNSSINVSTDYPLMLGRDGSSRRDNFFPGFIDEIKILNYGWTATEVLNEFRRFSF